MRFLLLVITPLGDQEVWYPHWIEAATSKEAEELAKQIAFSQYQKSTEDLGRYRFELFQTSSILPTTLGRTWVEEFLQSQRKSKERDVEQKLVGRSGAAGSGSE